MEKQISLFGIEVKEEVGLDDAVEVKVKKKNNKVGVIEIKESTFNGDSTPDCYRTYKSGDVGISIDFWGHQEGYGCLYTMGEIAEQSVESRIEELKKRYKNYDKYEIKDNRIKQNTIIPKIEEKTIVEPIKEETKPSKFLIDIENRSSGEYAIFPKVEGEMFFASYCGTIGDGKKEEEIEALKKHMIEKGFVFDKVMEHTYTYPDDEPKFVEEKIKTLSEELKKYLKKKYKYDVTIRVLKSEDKK